MEIDFLGLNSHKGTTSNQQQEAPPYNVSSIWNGSAGVATSLSLSTTPDYLNFSTKKVEEQREKKWDLAACRKTSAPVMNPLGIDRRLCYYGGHGSLTSTIPVFGASSSSFIIDVNGDPRNMPQLSSRALYSAGTAAQASAMPLSADASAGGYVPTVAMARRATLARFLEKRLHRMNEGRTRHLAEVLRQRTKHGEEEKQQQPHDQIMINTRRQQVARRGQAHG